MLCVSESFFTVKIYIAVRTFEESGNEVGMLKSLFCECFHHDHQKGKYINYLTPGNDATEVPVVLGSASHHARFAPNG